MHQLVSRWPRLQLEAHRAAKLPARGSSPGRGTLRSALIGRSLASRRRWQGVILLALLANMLVAVTGQNACTSQAGCATDGSACLPSVVNAALGGTTSASTVGGWGTGVAVDGNTGGHYHNDRCTHTDANGGAGLANQWWQVDLGASYAVDLVRIHHRTDCCGDRLAGASITISDTADFSSGAACGTVVAAPLQEDGGSTEGWSNSKVTDVGSAGTVHGPWGSDTASVSTTVPLPSGATRCKVSWRSWAIDSRDGEVDSLKLDQVLVWDMPSRCREFNDGWNVGQACGFCVLDREWTGGMS
eukprot:COSAG02_NODE_4381_length_5425_cov_58.839655_1_plen_301_part_00